MDNKPQNDTFLYELREAPAPAFRNALKDRLHAQNTSCLSRLFTPRRTRGLAYAFALLLVVLALPYLRTVLRVDASGIPLRRKVTLNLDGHRYKITLLAPEQVDPDTPLGEMMDEAATGTCKYALSEIVDEAFARELLAFELLLPTALPSVFGDQQIKLMPATDCNPSISPHLGQQIDGYYNATSLLQWHDMRLDVATLNNLQMVSSIPIDIAGKGWLVRILPWIPDTEVAQINNRWRGFTVEMVEAEGRRVAILDWYDQSDPPLVGLRDAYWYQDGVVHRILADSIGGVEGVIVSAEDLIKMIASTQ